MCSYSWDFVILGSGGFSGPGTVYTWHLEHNFSLRRKKYMDIVSNVSFLNYIPFNLKCNNFRAYK